MNFPAPGEIFAHKYRVENLLGKGGFSRVYRAIQEDLDRPVALKILRPPIQTDANAVERQKKLDGMAVRFNREAKMMSRLKSPHTITVYDYGRTEDGLLFMAIEYIDGMDLTHLIRAQGAIEPERVFKMLRQVLISLHEAHSLGMLHRDIKPQNIMIFDHLGQRDQIKLLDFGIVKLIDEEAKADQRDLTDDGTLVGTPRYMSPEYIRGAKIGPPSDIYSLGLVVYELLVGEQAIQAESSIQIIGKQLEPQSFFLPSLLEVSPEFRRIINKMLHKDPSQRYQNATEVLADMQDLEDQHIPLSSLVEVGLSEPSEGSPLAYDPAPMRTHLTATPEDVTKIELPSQRIPTTAPISAVPYQAANTQETTYDNFEDLGAPAPQKNNTPLLVGAIITLALFIFGGLALVALKNNQQPQTAPDQPKLATTSATPELQFYEIKTEPTGALVTINGTSMGKAPLKLPSSQLQFPATVTASLDGATITQQLEQSQHSLDLVLPAPQPAKPTAEVATDNTPKDPEEEQPQTEEAPPKEEAPDAVEEQDKTQETVKKPNRKVGTTPKTTIKAEPKTTPKAEPKTQPKTEPKTEPKTTTPDIRKTNIDDVF